MSATCHARRRRRRALLLVCALAMLLAAPGPAGAAEGVAWRNDYGRALKEAAEKGVPLLVNVGSVDCFWCKQLDAKTFVDEEVARTLNTRFVPLKLDGNKNPQLVAALRVEKYPTLIFASADGAILGYREGFMEPGPLKEQMVKVLAAVGTPDWMARDFEAGQRACDRKDYGRAVTLLKGVVEDGKSRAVQVKARDLLAAIERQAAEQAARAQQLADKGKTQEAMDALVSLGKDYPGTLAARKGTQLHGELVSRGRNAALARQREAKEGLALAREDYKAQRFLICLDRCESLTRDYGDLEEGRAADRLAGEVKDNVEWAAKAADQLTERLCSLYLAQADAWLKKGQPQQAIQHLDRLVKLYPHSRQAETARGKLARLRGAPDVK